MRFQPIYDIAAVCALKGIRNAVLSPGSRCAPLTLAFVRHPELDTKTISDERSAAFIALGMSQATNKPVALICTSGTAVYNYAPAVAEAYFSNTPLIILTADRPQEWIGQHDGQTVFQEGIYGKHVKQSYQLPQDYEHPDSQWEINRIVNEAVNLANAEPKGPVHINVPFREPLYPGAEAQVAYSDQVRIFDEVSADLQLTDHTIVELLKEWSNHQRILVVAGQNQRNSTLIESIRQFTAAHDIPVVGDVLSNLHELENVSRRAEAFLGAAPDKIKESLTPDLLITFGQSIISKNLKLFLRKAKVKHHWHIQPAGTVADTYQHVTKVIRSKPETFFQILAAVDKPKGFESQKQLNYQKIWDIEERRASRAIQGFFPGEEMGELELVNSVLDQLPADSNLHLANSMSVRYANLLSVSHLKEDVGIYSNRGTSGIDGCSSTAVGFSLVSEKPQFLITGDMAFFYDRNAFWHNYKVPNLRIVVLNNHGGIIFKMIDGPAALPEADEYFVTNQKHNAAALCSEFDFDYLTIKNKRQVKNILKDFFDFDGRTKILELESSIELNLKVIEQLKIKIRESYEL